MSGLVGRGLVRSSRKLLSSSTIWVRGNLVNVSVEKRAVKSFEHRNFSSTCTVGVRLYTSRHEWVTFCLKLSSFKVLCPRWVEQEGTEARVGITQYAADALGDVVFAELPEQGRQVVLLSIYAETTSLAP